MPMTMKSRCLALLLVTLACVPPALAQSLPTIELTINGHRVTADVAATAVSHTVFEECRSWLKPSDHVPIMTEFAL